MVNKEEIEQPIEPENEIEKRKPKPFRYVSNLDELKDTQDEPIMEHSVMTDEKATSEKLRENFDSTLGIGDMNAVENVIKKHQQKRNKDQSIDIA